MTARCAIYATRPERCREYPRHDDWIMPECTYTFDAAGNIWKQAPAFEQHILYDQVPLLNISSFYSKHGDVFAYACLAFSGLLMLSSLFLCRKN